jgi:hypothetical protein
MDTGTSKQITVAQAILEHAKEEIRKHADNGITLAGVEAVIDRIIREYR